MISTDMFAEFVIPHLQDQCRRCDYSVYHLDGPAAMKHLDLLVQVPELNAIQWTAGASMPPGADPRWWEPIWQKVYGAGKSAMVNGPPEMLEPFLKEFGQAGTLYTTSAESEAAARELLEKAENWG
jgi:hypothetical protein